MVRTRGPLLSVEASGTQAKTLTHSSWKGRSYLKRPGKPTNNKQASQLGIRAAMAFITKSWQDLTPAQQDTWSPDNTPFDLPAYNAYLCFNLERSADDQVMVKLYPPTPGTYTVNVINFGADSFHKFLRLHFRISSNRGHWSAEIHRSPTQIFTASPSNAVAIVHPQLRTVTTYYDDTPPHKGMWYYKLHLGDEKGNIGPTVGPFGTDWT